MVKFYHIKSFRGGVEIKNIVKYHNDINKIPLRKFNEKEINLFFSLLFKAKKEGLNKIKINFSDLRKIANGDINSPRFIKSLENLNYKLLNLNQKIILEDEKIVMFNLFSEFTIDPINKDLEIQIHERFFYMLNDFLSYTQFELKQLVGLRSSYSKNIFRLLKQFESTKILSIYMDEFKRILCIPDSYRMSHIDQKVLKPALKELSPFFIDLKLEKIKKDRKVNSLKFSWSRETLLKDEKKLKTKEVIISKKLLSYIEILKTKNRYITPYITPKNIEILLKEWNEERLIKGLKFAKNQIQKEFSSLNYLKKVIETGLEASEKVFAIKESEEEKLEIKEEVRKEEKKVIEKEVEEKDTSILDIKEKIIKWCFKNQKYSLGEEVEQIKTFIEASKFIMKYNVEI